MFRARTALNRVVFLSACRIEKRRFTSMNFNETSMTSINGEHFGFIGKVNHAARPFPRDEIALFNQRSKNGLLRVARDFKSAIIGDFL